MFSGIDPDWCEGDVTTTTTTPTTSTGYLFFCYIFSVHFDPPKMCISFHKKRWGWGRRRKLIFIQSLGFGALFCAENNFCPYGVLRVPLQVEYFFYF